MAKRLSLVALLVFLGANTANAAPIFFSASLSGANENPPNASPGTGTALVTFDPVDHTMRVEAGFSGLIGNTTAAHIHCCVDPPGNIGVATQTPSFILFPLGVTSGVFDDTFDLTLATSFSGSFVTAHGGTAAGAEAALLAGLLAGQAYFNIHTTAFPGGEIRGFLAQQVPEPSIMTLLAGGLAALTAARQRRRVRRHGSS